MKMKNSIICWRDNSALREEILSHDYELAMVRVKRFSPDLFSFCIKVNDERDIVTV